MLCDRVLGRREEGQTAAGDADRLDHLDLAWDACHRRAQQATTRNGRPVRLLLRPGTTLRHGDVLVDSQDYLLVIHVRDVETIVVRPTSLRQAAVVALELGNLHVPVQITEDAIVTLPDGPAEAALFKHGIPFTVEQRRFEPMPVSGLAWTVAGAAPSIVTRSPKEL
jgi:urease accessory protein